MTTRASPCLCTQFEMTTAALSGNANPVTCEVSQQQIKRKLTGNFPWKGTIFELYKHIFSYWYRWNSQLEKKNIISYTFNFRLDQSSDAVVYHQLELNVRQQMWYIAPDRSYSVWPVHKCSRKRVNKFVIYIYIHFSSLVTPTRWIIEFWRDCGPDNSKTSKLYVCSICFGWRLTVEHSILIDRHVRWYLISLWDIGLPDVAAPHFRHCNEWILAKLSIKYCVQYQHSAEYFKMHDEFDAMIPIYVLDMYEQFNIYRFTGCWLDSRTIFN